MKRILSLRERPQAGNGPIGVAGVDDRKVAGPGANDDDTGARMDAAANRATESP